MFGLFRKPPSRLELIKQGVAGTVEHAYDALTDTLSHVPVDKLDNVKHSITDTAAHAWDAVSHTAGTVAHKASDAREVATKTAAERAAAARDVAAGAVSRVGAVKDTAAKAVASRVSFGRAAAQDAVEDAQDTAQDTTARVAQEAEDARANAEQKAWWAFRSARSRVPDRDEVQDRVEEEIEQHIQPVEIETSDTSSKWLWIGIGVLAGIVIGIMLAPTAGRRSRALVKDKLNKAGHDAADLKAAAASKATDLSNRATGLAHAAKAKASGEEDDADDNTIADRVRTTLGENEATSHLERINVDCVDGVVTLRGPMLEEPVQQAVQAVVAAVKGVREVKTAFLTSDAPEDSATFGG